MDDSKQQTHLTARLDLAAHRRHLAFSETPAMIGAGLLFILSSFALLWWFETGSSKPRTIEDEMSRKVVSANFKTFDAKLENKVVYLSGPVTAQPIADAGFLIPQPYARLERVVEMFQYTGAITQTVTKVPGKPQKLPRAKAKKGAKSSRWNKNARAAKNAPDTTVTTASPVIAWRAVDRPVQAAKDPKYRNPVPRLRNKIFTAGLQLGPLNASKLTMPMEKAVPVKLTQEMLANKTFSTDGTWIFLAGKREPKLGDIRITYKFVAAGQKFSAVGLQKGRALEAYTSSLGTKLIVKPGLVPLKDLLPPSVGQSKDDIWLWRLVIGFLLGAGIFITVLPFTEFLAMLPLPSALKQVTTGFVALVAAILVETVLTILTRVTLSYWILIAAFLGTLGCVIYAHYRRRNQGQKTIRTTMVDLPPETQAPRDVG